jgi:hypothetical protein
VFVRIVGVFLCIICFVQAEGNAMHRLAVCAVCKNESFYLREWLEYHMLVGVEHFYLYDNMSDDASSEILVPYVDKGLVTLIPWPVETHTQNEHLHNVQLPAYNHALERAKDEAEWVAFIDIDEFLVPMKHENMVAFLDEYHSCVGIAINWQMYGTSGLEELPPGGLIIEHLRLKAVKDHPMNQMVKMIVRPRSVEKIENPHYVKFIADFHAVDSSGRPLPYGSMGQPVNVGTIRINHYWCGTRSWLINEKLPRRKQWGFAFPADMLESIIATYNATEDDSMMRFISPLRKRLGL